MPNLKNPYVLVLSSLLAGGITSFVVFHKEDRTPAFNQSESVSGKTAKNNNSKTTGGDANTSINSTGIDANDDNQDDQYKFAYQKGFDLIKPLLLAKQKTESSEFVPLKAKIMNLVEDDKRVGLLNSATVYLMSLSDGSWTYINPDENYNPGSLIKVPMLITYLREAENNPQLLNKKIVYATPGKVPSQTYNSMAIVPGHSYTIKELLHYMIAYSDNNATLLLNQNIDPNLFKKTFTDLNIPEPDVYDQNYTITARRISKFFIVLYNATYLSRKSSEYAMELLGECNFREGMVKELPATIRVSHKFGEWSNNKINVHELHESGIVYYNNKTYMLTVMTKGNKIKELSDEISKISKMIYDDISSK